jgi:hypothetical protein
VRWAETGSVQQPVETCRRGIFQLRQMGSEASLSLQNNDLRRLFAKRIRAMLQPAEFFNTRQVPR